MDSKKGAPDVPSVGEALDLIIASNCAAAKDICDEILSSHDPTSEDHTDACFLLLDIAVNTHRGMHIEAIGKWRKSLCRVIEEFMDSGANEVVYCLFRETFQPNHPSLRTLPAFWPCWSRRAIQRRTFSSVLICTRQRYVRSVVLRERSEATDQHYYDQL